MGNSLIRLSIILASVAAELSEASVPDVGLTQICIWLPIILVLIIYSAVYSMAYMDNGRDSLLFAKFLISESDRERR